MNEQKLAVNRRRFITGLSAAGITSTLLPGALTAVAQDADEVTVEMLAAAQRIAGLDFTREGTGAHRRESESAGRQARRRDPARGQPGERRAAGHRVQPGAAGDDAAERAPSDAAGRHRGDHAVHRRGTGVPAAHAPGEARRDPPGEAVGADRAVPGPVAAARSDAALRRQLHRGDCPAPGAAGRRGGRGGHLPRAPARDPLGRQGPACGSRHAHDLGSLALPAADHRHRRHRVHAADRGGGHPRRQAVDGRPGVRRSLVRRPDAEPVEYGAGVERILRGLGGGDRGGAGRVRHRDRDARLDHLAVDPQRDHRPAADVRAGEPVRRDGAGLDAGQDRPDVPLRRGLRARLRCDPRTRRPGQHGPGRAVQLGCRGRPHRPAGRLPAVELRRGRRRGGSPNPERAGAGAARRWRTTGPPSTRCAAWA